MKRRYEDALRTYEEKDFDILVMISRPNSYKTRVFCKNLVEKGVDYITFTRQSSFDENPLNNSFRLENLPESSEVIIDELSDDATTVDFNDLVRGLIQKNNKIIIVTNHLGDDNEMLLKKNYPVLKDIRLRIVQYD